MTNPDSVLKCFCVSAGKESTFNAGDLGLIAGLGRSPGEGKSYPFQCSGLEKSMECTIHGVAKSWTVLRNFHFITLPTTVCIVKSMVFPVVTYGCESSIVKKAECQRTDAFKLWCWRRLLKIPCMARRSNQSILREINPEYSLEGLILKLQYFGHLM